MSDKLYQCVITPNVKPYKLKSTKWTVRFGRSVHIDATTTPWTVWVTAAPIKRNPHPKMRKLSAKAAEILINKMNWP